MQSHGNPTSTNLSNASLSSLLASQEMRYAHYCSEKEQEEVVAAGFQYYLEPHSNDSLGL